jgi:hypothetical protein
VKRFAKCWLCLVALLTLALPLEMRADSIKIRFVTNPPANGNNGNNQGNSASNAGGNSGNNSGSTNNDGNGNSAGSGGSSSSNTGSSGAGSSSSGSTQDNSNSGNGTGTGSGSSNTTTSGSGSSSGSNSNNGNSGNGGNNGSVQVNGVLHLCITGQVCPNDTPLGVQVATTASPSLGIIRSPDVPITFPHLDLAILVPDAAAGASTLDFSVEFGTGVSNATLFSTTPWTSGSLFSDYLNLNTTGGPPQPLSAFLSATQQVAGNQNTGYFVYLAVFNPPNTSLPTDSTFGGCDQPNLPCPTLFAFPNGTVFTAFATDESGNPVLDTTAQSSAVLIKTPPRVPEPASMVLLGSGLLTVVLRRCGSRRKR